MSAFSIAYNNFKNNLKVYTLFFISNVFSVIVLTNFIILLNSGLLSYFEGVSEENMKILLDMIIFILAIFILFFTWYSSNIFLKNRKKEIGIYVFMGVNSFNVGKIYFIEIMLIGLSSCFIGTVIGVIISKLFQMIVFTMAGFSIDIKFSFDLISILYGMFIFMGIFLLMSIKGFISIVRSSVNELLNDNRKSEKVNKINALTYILGLASLFLIILGYFLIYKHKSYAFKTLVLVCIGTYGLFASMMPIVFKFLTQRKSLLYSGENIITINNLVYRMKKNAATYATIAILTACTITVLGTAVSMRTFYNESSANNTIFSMSFCSDYSIENKNNIKNTLTKIGNEKYELDETVLKAKSTLHDVAESENEDYIVLSYDQLVRILKTNNNEKSLKLINEDMVFGNKAIFIERPETLMSLLGNDEITVNDIEFKVDENKIRLCTLGSALNYEIIVVNNENYAKLKENSKPVYFYGLKIDNEERLLNEDTAQDMISEMETYIDTNNVTGSIGVYRNEGITWLKGVYSIGTFLFMVFIIAEASIIYIKVYSDAADDKDKYKILLNIGASHKDLRKSINKEVILLYLIPILIGLVHSFFAIRSLGQFMSVDLNFTFLISVAVCMIIFGISAFMSMISFKRIVGV